MTEAANARAPTTLRFQNLANVVVRGLLRTPIVCRVVGTRLVTIYVVGRTSGTRYSIPTAYTGDGSSLLIGTSFRWARNLRTGDPIDIRLLGRRRTADVEVVADEAGVVACYDTIVRGNRQFARFNHIRLDAAGNPLRADLHQAWAAGARAIRLTPR